MNIILIAGKDHGGKVQTAARAETTALHSVTLI